MGTRWTRRAGAVRGRDSRTVRASVRRGGAGCGGIASGSGRWRSWSRRHPDSRRAGPAATGRCGWRGWRRGSSSRVDRDASGCRRCPDRSSRRRTRRCRWGRGRSRPRRESGPRWCFGSTQQSRASVSRCQRRPLAAFGRDDIDRAAGGGDAAIVLVAHDEFERMRTDSASVGTHVQRSAC